MALPANISTRWVEGQFLTNVNDGVDPDQKPDSMAAQGIVTFVAAVPYLPDATAEPNPATLLMIPRVAVLDEDGYICTPVRGTLTPAYRGIMLECTDDPDGGVVRWTWNVKYAFTPVDGVTPTIPSHSFPLPEASEPLDLTRVVKVPSSTGIGKEQAEVLAASAQAAAVRAAADAAKAMAAAEEALGAAAATDGNVSSLVGTAGTATNAAVARQVDAAAASKLDADTAAETYQSIDGLDAVAASKVDAANSALRRAVDERAQAAASSKLDATQAADTFQTRADGARVEALTNDTRIGSLVDGSGTATNAATVRVVDQVGVKFTTKNTQPVNVLDYGAKGNWTSGSNGVDNLAAFNAATAVAIAEGRKLRIPDGKYRMSGEWDIYRPSSSGKILTIEGDSRDNTWIVADFYGAEKALIKNYDPAWLGRGAPTNYFNLQLRTTSRTLGANPVLMHNGGWGESVMDHVKFGPSNNTQFRGVGLQNIRAVDTVMYYGGRNFLYKPTDGITFTVALPGIITASADVFTASDVGMLFFLAPANDSTRIMYRIKSVTDARNAVIDAAETPVIAATIPSKGNFDAALATMSEGSNVLTANGPCFNATDVGRVVVVRAARVGAWGKALLRAAITGYISPTQVTLDTPASAAVTKTPFATPVFDVYSLKGTGAPVGLTASSTDIKWTNLQLEAYAGLGVSIIDGLQWHVNDQKIHGEHDPVDARMSTGMVWFDSLSGVFSGEFDGGSHSDTRLYACNMNDTLSIPALSTRRVRNEKLFMVEDWANTSGFVQMGPLVVYRQDDAGPEAYVTDRSLAAGRGRKLAFTSTVTMVGGTIPVRIYSGMGTYFTPDGRMVRNGTGTAGVDIELGSDLGSRIQFEDYGARKYSIGNIAGGGTTFNLYDETAGAVRWQVNTNGDFTPGSAGTQNLGSSAMKWKDFYADRTVIGGVSQSVGVGSPEGVVVAPVGSEYIDTAGTAGTIRWGKKAGAGSTGWVALW